MVYVNKNFNMQVKNNNKYNNLKNICNMLYNDLP